MHNRLKNTSKDTYEKDNDTRYYEVIISIKDRGIGTDPYMQDKLFSKFVTKSDTGSGLGLYISKSIVEAHGGKIYTEIIVMAMVLPLHLAFQFRELQ
jgi:signal transduction histidine kinase